MINDKLVLDDVENLQIKIGAKFFIETSTKANHNVKLLFKKLLNHYLILIKILMINQMIIIIIIIIIIINWKLLI